MTQAAIEAWHQSATSAIGVESGEWLNAELARRGLMFGNRPLCTVIRPRFLSRPQYGLMRERITILLRAFNTALESFLVSH